MRQQFLKGLISGIAGCLACLAVSAQQPLSLDEAIQTALKNNFDVKQSELQMQSAKVYYDQSKADMLPNINGFINHGINKGRSIDPFTNSYVDQQLSFASYSLQGDLLLFNGLALYNSIQRDKLAYEAGKMDLRQARDNTALAVTLAYLQVLLNEELLKISTAQSELTAKQVERLEILNKEGSIVPATLFDLKGQYSNDKLAMVNNANAVNAAKLSLCQLMFIPYNEALLLSSSELEGVPTPYGMTADEIFQQALKNLPAIKAEEYRTQSTIKAVKAIKGQYYPSLVLNGSLNTNYSSVAEKSIPGAISEVPSGDYVQVNGTKYDVITQSQSFTSQNIGYWDQLSNNYNTSVSLGLRIPIFNSFVVKNRVRLAKINQMNQEYTYQNVQLRLRQQVEQAAFNAAAAYDRYLASLDQVNAFSESFRIAEIRFNEGAINSVDYLTAKNNSDRANLNLTQARFEYIFRTKVLDYYAGKLKFN